MTTLFAAFLISFFVALILTRLMMPLAVRMGIVDKPGDYRKIHRTIIPEMGGPAILLAFITPITLLIIKPELSTISDLLLGRSSELAGIMIGACMTLVLGIIDDKYNIKSTWKLLGQIIIAVIVFYCGLQINQISNPFPGGSDFSLGVFAMPITVLWIVACMNAVNLLDGIDGLAAGVCLFVGLTVLLVSLHYNNFLGAIMMASMSGATLGFLIFNFPPAKIFLGDSGSLLLGFLVASLSLAGTSRKAEAAVALFVPVIALGLPIFDTSMAILRRWYKRLPIDTPDRMHIHHVLVGMGYSQRRVVLILYSICLVLGGAALLITFSRSEIVVLVIGSLTIMTMVSVRIFSGVKFRDIMVKIDSDRTKNEQMRNYRAAIEQARYEIKNAESADSLWAICCRAFETLELNSTELIPNRNALNIKPLTWHSEKADGSRNTEPDSWTLRMSIKNKGEILGQLVMYKEITEKKVCLPFEIVGILEQLAESIGERLSSMTDNNNPNTNRGNL